MSKLLHGKHKVAKYGKRMFQMDNLENSIVSGNRTGQYLEDRKLLLLHNSPVKHDTNIEYRDFRSLTVLDRKFDHVCFLLSVSKVNWPKLEICVKR